MHKNLQDKFIKFSTFDNNGVWRGNGVGKVMLVEQGDRVIVSTYEHPFFKKGELIEIMPWVKEGREKTDVILKVGGSYDEFRKTK